MKDVLTSNDKLGAQRMELLERSAAAVLLLSVASLVWIIVTARWPDWLRLASLEIEVLIVLGLLTAALLLVSVVALRHTRQAPATVEVDDEIS